MPVLIRYSNSYTRLLITMLLYHLHILNIVQLATFARLCANLGENKGDYYAFPTPQAMASKDEEFYKSIGAGYRAKYLAVTSKLVADGQCYCIICIY